MIIIRIEGGLGNIMFQYGLSRQLELKQKANIKYDVSSCYVNPLGDYSLSLEPFSISIKDRFTTPEEVAAFAKYQKKIGKRWFFHNMFIADETKYIQEKGFTFNPHVLDCADNVLIRGWWQNERYFIDVRDQLLKDFTVRAPLTGTNKQVADEIQSSPSVSLHIRRLDFVSNPNTKKYHGELTKEYYDAALRKIASHVKTPTLFIFSDDIEWVKKHMPFSYKTIYVTGNNDAPHEDMRLMSMCQHNIIANSSFSWWGAWLNNHSGRIVVAPKRWTNDSQDSDQRIAKGWIAI
jgi:hypothetical protein